MITEQQLRNIFQYEFLSDISEVVYRKYTTDTIPDYTLRLSNASDTVHINVYVRTPSYIHLADIATGFTISSTEGIIIPPKTFTDVLITLDPTGIDDSIDASPRITFELRALEPSTADVDDDSPPPDSPPPASPPGTGVGAGTINPLFPTRRRIESELDEVVGPIAEQ